MKKSFHKMFPNEHLGIVRFKTGDLFMEEILDINHIYKTDKHFSDIHYIVLNFTSCIPKFNIEELDIILNNFLNNIQKNNHIKRVFLVDAPMQTAYAHLFIQDIFDSSAYCSTLEKAHEFLGIPITLDKFISLVNQQ